MNAAELIEYIRTAEKKTPVKVYIWERFPTSFPNAKIFPAGDGAKIVFGDWRDIGPAIEAQQDAIADIVIERDLIKRKDKIMDLDLKMRKAHVQRVNKGKCKASLTAPFTNILHLIDRMGNSCVNLADVASNEISLNYFMVN